MKYKIMKAIVKMLWRRVYVPLNKPASIKRLLAFCIRKRNEYKGA